MNSAKWEFLKSLYVKDHLSKTLKSPRIRLNALAKIESLITTFFPEIIQDPLVLSKIEKEDLKKRLENKKGIPLNSAECSVLTGLYKFLPASNSEQVVKSALGLQKQRQSQQPEDVRPKELISLKESLNPLTTLNSRILVLGTLPGDVSIARQEYYANQRNSFWRLISDIFGFSLPVSYVDKRRLLEKSFISLWDVCAVGERKGSLDLAIRKEVPNRLDEFLACNPSIHLVAFNGTRAEALYDKYFPRSADLKYLSLPSTSSANTSTNYEQKLAFWRQIINY